MWQAEIEQKDITSKTGFVEVSDEAVEMKVVWLELQESRVLMVMNI